MEVVIVVVAWLKYFLCSGPAPTVALPAQQQISEKSVDPSLDPWESFRVTPLVSQVSPSLATDVPHDLGE